MKKVITIITAFLLVCGTFGGMLKVEAKSTSNYAVTPSLITTSSAQVQIKTNYSFSANEEGTVSVRIPTPLVKSVADINVLSDIVQMDSVSKTLVGTAWVEDNTCPTWDGSYWDVKMSIKNGNVAGEGTITVTSNTPTFIANCKVNTLPVELFVDNVLNKSSEVNVAIAGTAPVVINSSIENPKFSSTKAQYQEALATLTSDQYSAYANNLKMGIGSISAFDATKNIVKNSINGYMMDAAGPKGVVLRGDLPVGTSIYANPNPQFPTTASGLMLVEQKIDITDPKLPNISGALTSVSNQYIEIGGNYGDPLEPKQIRISTDSTTGQVRYEVNVGDLANDVKLFINYYQQVDFIPEISDLHTYPEFITTTEVTWDNGFGGKSVTWQSFDDLNSTAYTASEAVSTDLIYPGDDLLYTITLKANVDDLNIILFDSVLPTTSIKADSVMVNSSACSSSVNAETNRIAINCAALNVNETITITFAVDTSETIFGENLVNTFTIAASDGSFLTGNTVDTDVAGGKVTVHYVDEAGTKLVPSIELIDRVGVAFMTEQKTIDGYVFKEVMEPTSGIFTTTEQSVTYIYQPLVDSTTDNNKSETDGEQESALPITGQNFNILLSIGIISIVSAGIIFRKIRK